MKGFLRSVLIMVVLAAAIVGGFYAYLNQTNPADDGLVNEVVLDDKNKIEEAREKARALNTDADGDGLTLAEEQRLGTSDKTTDSDGDGVPDNVDIAPLGIGRKVSKTLNWEYKGEQHSVEAYLPIDVSDYYEKKTRTQHTFDSQHYLPFIHSNDIGIERLAAELKAIIDANGSWDYYDEVMFVVSMVQQMRYAKSAIAGFDLTTKYPMQTIITGRGDCEDTSVLAAALLKKLEYDVKLVQLEVDGRKSHLGIGVWANGVKGTSWEKGGRTFYYVETTRPEHEFGELPIEWKEGISAVLIDI